MLNKKKLYWLLQISGWLIYVSIIGVFNVLTGNNLSIESVISLFAIYFILLSASHSYKLIITKLQWVKLTILQLIPRVLSGVFLVGILVYFLNSIVLEWLIVQHNYSFNLQELFLSVLSWSLLFLIWSLLYFLFQYINNYKQEEIKNLKWQAAKNEIELNKLKSQLNPHFIFNSMNSIRALVDENPNLAKEAITQLSNVLRNSLLMGKKKLIPLSDEIKLVNDYLSLEKTRFEEKLIIEQNIANNTLQFLVPPLMVQTLVENGIKHGTSRLPKGGKLQIFSMLKDGNLVITIKNSGHYDNDRKSETGFGLVNTKQRLQLIYGDKASFAINNENELVKTEIIIPKQTIF